jgi:hypothetical protein
MEEVLAIYKVIFQYKTIHYVGIKQTKKLFEPAHNHWRSSLGAKLGHGPPIIFARKLVLLLYASMA